MRILEIIFGKNEDKINYENVKKILDSIVVCRILKAEDKQLKHKRYPTFCNFIVN